MAEINSFLESCESVADQEDDESWTLSWTDVSQGRDHVSLGVLIETHRVSIPNQTWEIRATNPVEMNLKAGRSNGAALFGDHPLLWGFSEPVSQLNFTGPSGRHEVLLWELYERHHALTEDFIPFDRFMNAHFIRNRLSGGSGVLANGPDRLLREYASVLKRSDLAPYFPYPAKPPVRWDEDRRHRVAEDRHFSVLILGDSHIIATNFSAEQV